MEFQEPGNKDISYLRQKQEGYNVLLVNSNPATIMTGPEIADIIYLEPPTVKLLAKI